MPHAHRRAIAAVAAVALLAPALAAQDTTATVLAGRVVDDRAAPLPGAPVFLLETGDSTRSGADGRFALRTTWRGAATLVARALGRIPATADVVLPLAADAPPLVLVLERAPAAIVAVRVVAAGEYTVAEGPTATLSPLEIVRTPGTAANTARAVQTLPGVQNVDEGTGLFVRGGDLLETRVLVDDAWLPAPYRADNPTGTAGASVDPFLLDRVTFAAGGFGARQGNALSGLVSLELEGRPERAGGSLGLTATGARAAGALPLGRRVGVRAAAGTFALGPLVRTFGEAQPFRPAPRGGDGSASVEWGYRDGGRVRAFVLEEHNEFGVGAPGALAAPDYTADTRTALTVVSWRDSAGPLRPAVTLARSRYVRREAAGTFALRSDYDTRQLVARLGWQATSTLRVTVGAEHEDLDAAFDGRSGATTGTVGDTIAARVPGRRTGTFGEVAWHAPGSLSLVAGVRSDAATLTGGRTVDPRLSLGWTRGPWALTAAAGVYHQLPDPALVRGGAVAPMRARQLLAGVQRDGDALALRLEGYVKRYDGLVLVTRARDIVAGGTGDVAGADALVRWRIGERASGRLAWSVLHARRTDPDTRRRARAPTDVTHSVTLVTERRIGPIVLGSSLRWATGRPFTDVIGTRADTLAGTIAPVWGTPFDARLPAQLRSDLSADWFRPLGGRRAIVIFASLSNVFDRENVVDVGWSADWSRRIPRRAPFNRALFAGATLLF